MALISDIERLLVVLIGTAAIVLGAAYGAYHGLCGRFQLSDPPASTEVQRGGPSRAPVPEVHETPAPTQLHLSVGGMCTFGPAVGEGSAGRILHCQPASPRMKSVACPHAALAKRRRPASEG